MDCFFYTWEPLITFIISILILGVAIAATFFIPWKISKRQMYLALLTEYRSAEMGVAIQKIWGFAEQCYISNKQMDEEYVRIFRSDQLRCSTVQEWQSTLHYYRRKISQFYQQLAGLGPWFLKKQARKNLSPRDLHIIHIVFELEMHAVPKIICALCDNQIESALPPVLLPSSKKDLHKSQSTMYELYLQSQAPTWKDVPICRQQFLEDTYSWLKKQERRNLRKEKNMEFNTEEKFNIEKKKAFPKEFDGLYGSYDAINEAIKNWFGGYYRSGQTAFDIAHYKTIQDELNKMRATLEQFLTEGGYLIEKSKKNN